MRGGNDTDHSERGIYSVFPLFKIRDDGVIFFLFFFVNLRELLHQHSCKFMTFLSELSSKAAAVSHPQKIFLILKNAGGKKSIQILLPSLSPLIYSNRNPKVKSLFLRFSIRYYFCTFFLLFSQLQCNTYYSTTLSDLLNPLNHQLRWKSGHISLFASDIPTTEIVLWESGTDLGGMKKIYIYLTSPSTLLNHISENSVYMWQRFEQKYRYVAVFLSHKCPDVDSDHIGTSVLLAYLVPQFI